VDDREYQWWQSCDVTLRWFCQIGNDCGCRAKQREALSGKQLSGRVWTIWIFNSLRAFPILSTIGLVCFQMRLDIGTESRMDREGTTYSAGGVFFNDC
jgi:hypothetical protein